MNIFFWKKNTIIDEFAFSMASELYSVIPPDQAFEYFADKTDKKQTIKIEKKLNQQVYISINHIKHFKNKNSLGIYGKARLHLKFMERLNELGYTKDVAKQINELLLINTP